MAGYRIGRSKELPALEIQTPKHMLDVTTKDFHFYLSLAREASKLLRSGLQELLGILGTLAMRDNFSYTIQANFGGSRFIVL